MSVVVSLRTATRYISRAARQCREAVRGAGARQVFVAHEGGEPPDRGEHLVFEKLAVSTASCSRTGADTASGKRLIGAHSALASMPGGSGVSDSSCFSELSTMMRGMVTPAAAPSRMTRAAPPMNSG